MTGQSPSTRTIIVSPPRREVQDKGPLLLPELRPEEPVWVDLPGTDRTVLDKVQQILGFSPEVITYCLLRHHTAKVIHTDSGLFLVTFLALPHSSSLFTLWELKMCVSSRFLLTVHRPSSPASCSLESRLPSLRGAIDLGTGHLLRLILEEAVQSYKTAVAEVEKRLPRKEECDPGQTPETAVAKIEDHLPRGERRDSEQTPEEQVRSRRVSRAEKFALFLRDQRAFLQNIEREGRKLFHPDDHIRLKWLGERVGVLARIAWETARALREGKKKAHTGKEKTQDPQSLGGVGVGRELYGAGKDGDSHRR